MNFRIKDETHGDGTDSIVRVSFDNFGNLYFESSEEVYQININSEGAPTAEPGDYSIKEIDTKEVSNFQPIHNKLESRAKEELDRDIYFYFKEEKEFYEEEEEDSGESNRSLEFQDDDLLEKFGEDNLEFKFSAINPKYQPPIHSRTNGEVSSLYETFLYSDEKLCFKSCSKDNSALYRINLHLTGSFWIRAFGNRERLYEVVKTESGFEFRLLH